MSKIVPFILKRLRTSKGLSQEQLAVRAKINKQTIFRLERDPGSQTNTRERIIQSVARVLGTDPDVLTGQAPLPDATHDDIPGDQSKLKFPTSHFAQNALHFVSERYNVTQQEIVELAPFLFCCVAEASLRQRRECVRALERACQAAKSLVDEMRHISGFDLETAEKMIATETASIDGQDIFGLMLDDEFGGADDFTENPFALFLDALANDTGGVAEFEGYANRDWPQYRVCPEEASQMVDGDSDLAEVILEGHVALSEMPRDLSRKHKERAEWIRAKVEAFRALLNRPIRETDDGAVS
jgi:transcriptional regulator with XRE-family HTH domain